MEKTEMETRKLMKFLEKYELSETEVKVYLRLLQGSKPVGVVALARLVGMGRTPVYNAIEKLEIKGLIARIMADNGYEYVATEVSNFEKYWQERLVPMRKLEEKMPEMLNFLGAVQAKNVYKSEVKYFSGREGLQQITYNSLRAKGDLYIYEVNQDMSVFIKKQTAEDYRQRLVDNGVVTHQMTNLPKIEGWTDVKGITGDLWDILYIDPEILKIGFETVIYNDVVAMYSVRGDNFFGIEIRNQALADQQVQMFRALARLATPMKKVGEQGEARV